MNTDLKNFFGWWGERPRESLMPRRAAFFNMAREDICLTCICVHLC